MDTAKPLRIDHVRLSRSAVPPNVEPAEAPRSTA